MSAEREDWAAALGSIRDDLISGEPSIAEVGVAVEVALTAVGRLLAAATDRPLLGFSAAVLSLDAVGDELAGPDGGTRSVVLPALTPTDVVGAGRQIRDLLVATVATARHVVAASTDPTLAHRTARAVLHLDDALSRIGEDLP